MSGFTCANITDSYNTGSGLLPGADSAGGRDSSPAINYWLSANVGAVYAPPGTYRLRSTVSFTRSGTILYGSGYGGYNGTTFKIDDSLGNIGDGFLCQDLRNCGVVQASISAYSARSTGYAVHIKGGDSAVVITTTQMAANQFQLDVDMDTQFNGVLVDDSSFGCWQTSIGSKRRAIWRDFTAGGTGILYASPGGAGHVVENVFMSNGLGASLGGPAIRVTGTGDLSLHKVDALGFTNGFLLNNSAPIATPVTGGGVSHVMMSCCQWDNTGGAVGADNIRIVPTDITRPILISIVDTWCGSGNNGIYASGFTGTGAASSILSFDGGTIAGQANVGVRGVSPVSAVNNIKLGSTIKYFLNTVANTDFT